MSRVTTGAVLLAAGGASRFGEPKQLLPINGIPMVRHAASIAQTCVDHVVVVTGACRADVEGCLAGLDVEPAFNSAWQAGMGTSIACGAIHLLRMHATVGACLVLLADQPFVTAADLAALVAAHHQRPTCIIASGYNDNPRGAPCLFPRRFVDELTRLDGPGGARPVLQRHHDAVISVRNPRAGMDIDTPADVRKWAGRGHTGEAQDEAPR